MNSTIRSTVTRSTVTRANLVRTAVYGLGARMSGVEGTGPATALPPGATPSRGCAGFSPSRERSDRDCQSHPSVKTWQPARTAKPANPN